jgi:hypothetical protein
VGCSFPDYLGNSEILFSIPFEPVLLFSTQVIVQMVGSQIQGSILSRECDGDIYPTNNESTHETNDPL